MIHPRTKLLHAVLIVAMIGILLPPMGMHPRPAQARQSAPVAFEPPQEAARPPSKHAPGSTQSASDAVATTNPADTDACILVANSSVYLPLVVRGGGVSGSSTTTPELPIRSSANTASLKGRVLDANDAANGIETPLFGVTICSLETGLSVKTDPNGEFLLTGLPAGESHVQYIGDTALPLNSYASYRSKIELADNTTKVIDRPIYLMKKDAGGEVPIDPNQTTTVDNANLGVTLTIPAHTVKNEDGSDYSGPLSVSEVPAGFTPGSLPDTLEPGFVVTVQPMGLNFAQPVPVTFPNTDNLPAGTELDIWSMDHATGEFFVAGRGKVSNDGSVINTFSGGVREASWHFVLPLLLNLLWPFDADGANQSPLNGAQCFSSLVTTHNGSLQTGFSLPDYVSMDQGHNLNFVYNSNRAYPFQLTPVEPTIPVQAALPPKLSVTYDISTAAISQTGYISTAGLNENANEPLRAVLPLDTSSLSTGVYNASLRVTSHYNRSAVSTADNDPLIVVNAQNSPFGAGWGLAGLSRLHENSDGSLLLTEGSGLAKRYVANTFSFTSFSNLDAFKLNGDTVDINKDPVIYDGQTVLRLTDARNWRTGNAILNEPIPLQINGQDVSFSADFQFQISASGGISDQDGSGADGIAFIMATDTRVGGAGIGIGYRGVNPSLVVEFDTYNNGGIDGYSGNHVGINLNGNLNSIALQPVSPRMNNGEVWYAWIDYDGVTNLLEARLSPTSQRPITATVTQTVDIAGILGQTTAFVGFTSGTGSAYGNHDIRAVGFNVFLSSDFNVNFYFSPLGDYSTLIKNTDGTYTHRLKDGNEIRFNSAGLQTAMVDRNGNTTFYAYDSQGRLISITDPAGLVTTFSYSGGLLNRVALPDGRPTIFTYSGNDLTDVIFPDGSSQSFAYDSRHLMTSETDRRGFVRTRQFDQYGRVIQASLPDGSTRATLASQKVGLIDPSSGVGTEANPAPVERPANVWSELTDGEGRLRTFTAGPVNRFASITDEAGLTTRYNRDSDGNTIQIGCSFSGLSIVHTNQASP